jgi:hypothetical protein
MTLLIASTLPLRYRKQYVERALRAGPARLEVIASTVGMGVAAIAAILDAMVAEHEVWLVDGSYQLNPPRRLAPISGESPSLALPPGALLMEARPPTQRTGAPSSL